MMSHINLWRGSWLIVGCAMAFSSVAAGSYPERPVRLIVPYAPGGSADIAARLISDEWSKKLGQPIIIENRAGAGGNVGVNVVAKGQPDGYLIGLQTVSLAINPAIFPSMPFDTLNDLAPFGTVASSQHVLVINPSVTASNVKELVELAKSEPGDLTYGSAGPGSTFHMAAELFKTVAEVDIMHIPYRGGAPALMDTIAGQIDMSFPVLSAALPQVKAGGLRALGVTGPHRSELMLDVPTLAEEGLSDYSFETWFMTFAPTGTPDAVIKKLNQTLNAALASQDLVSRMVEQGFDPMVSTVDESQIRLRQEMADWTKLVAKSGIEIE